MDAPPATPDPASLNPGLTYYYVPGDAVIGPDQGFQARGLPVIPVGRYQMTLRNHRRVVTFLNGLRVPEIQYATRLNRVTEDSDKNPTQAEKLKRALNMLNINREGTEVPQAISVPASAELEELSCKVRQFKGYGDEAKFAPPRPTVPLVAEGPTSRTF
jgi:hypothetical protein